MSHHPPPFPAVEHPGARHRASGWNGMSAAVWIVLVALMAAMAALGVLLLS